MKQIIASVFFDISYIIGNIIFCIFKNFELNLIVITARVYIDFQSNELFFHWNYFFFYFLLWHSHYIFEKYFNDIPMTFFKVMNGFFIGITFSKSNEFTFH